MCGFLTCLKSSDIIFPDFTLSKESLKRRGPDSQNELISGNFYSYHSRLSIIDLDERSNQPFVSSCGRYIIVFNGEIYNYKELSNYLTTNNILLRTSSDTEVLLHLYILEGEPMLNKIRGMFSFFIWDLKLNHGFAARDPYGIKPLYYSYTLNSIIFSSQVKAIVLSQGSNIAINSEAISEFKLFGSITQDSSFFNDIFCFKPGYKMKISGHSILNYECWANTDSFFLKSEIGESLKIDFANLKSIVHNALVDTVSHHIVADVKVGIFLSSGIDSSTLASLLKEINLSDVIGITVVFEDDDNDESHFASLLAKEFGFTLFIKRVSKTEFYNDLEDIFKSMDQPSIDGINTWYAAKAASECGIKVVLSGVGADELFQGYNFYNSYPKYASIISKLLRIKVTYLLIKYFTRILSLISQNRKWIYVSSWMKDFVGGWLLFRSFMTPIEIEDIKGNSNFLNSTLENFKLKNQRSDLNCLETLIYLDNKYYLKNQLLRDSDWATMYHGVELRTPFVDYTLLKNIIPIKSFMEFFPNKSLLYTSLKYKLPDYIVKRKKTGFSTPIKKWILEGFDVNSKNSYSNFIISRYLQSLNINY